MKIEIEEHVDVIKKFKDGNDDVLKEMYQSYEDPFITWACRHFNISRDEGKDIFQLAVITFYSNVKSEKLQHLTCTVKTYLFSIGRKLLLKLNRKKIRNEPLNYESIEIA